MLWSGTGEDGKMVGNGGEPEAAQCLEANSKAPDVFLCCNGRSRQVPIARAPAPLTGAACQTTYGQQDARTCSGSWPTGEGFRENSEAKAKVQTGHMLRSPAEAINPSAQRSPLAMRRGARGELTPLVSSHPDRCDDNQVRDY